MFDVSRNWRCISATDLAGRGQLAIGREIVRVQADFGKIFNAGTEFQKDGSQFDQLFQDGDRFKLGKLDATVLHVPGHTHALLAYVIGDAVFPGDTLFMSDYGTARCDFLGGDARTPYRYEGVSEDAFVKMRNDRDATLAMPRLILPSVQVNMRAGKLPPAEVNGIHYLKIPINAL
ncbi:hypothetical protein ATY81_00485 [Rhizobium sp. R72]|nr:hypothetical protein ATY81_00485 [Rhizobium sp. R72]OWW05569.1 hypothetical protein ATY80_00485 [Rhizobium sp. R711]